MLLFFLTTLLADNCCFSIFNFVNFCVFLIRFLTCRLFTPEDEEGSDVIYQYRVDFLSDYHLLCIALPGCCLVYIQYIQ